MNRNLESGDSLAGAEFVITHEFAAPRERVWKAMTEPNHLAQWWGPKGFTAPVCEWDARPGGKVFVVMRAPDGTDCPMGGEFYELLPLERMTVMTGALNTDGNFLFQFLHIATLDECNGKTKLTMRSRLLRATPEAEQSIGGFEMGMTLSIERLEGHLAQGTEPLVVERTFAAPIGKVWAAFTTKEAMREWCFEVDAFKPENGFEFQFYAGKEDARYLHRCRVAEVIPQKRLAYTWRYEGYAGDSLVSFDLFSEGEKTRVKVTHLGLETFPPMSLFARENFREGWTQIVGTWLKQFIEGTAP